MIEELPGIILRGLVMGSIYALIAMGLNVQYGVGRVFNIAHGEFLMLGAMLTVTVYVAVGIDPLGSLAITGPFLFIFGFIIYRTLFTSLKNRAASPAVFEGSSLLVAFGFIFIIQNAALLIFGGRGSKRIDYLNVPIEIAGTVLRLNQVVAFAVAVVVGVVFYIFITRSRLGKAIRAAAQDPATAGLMGVNVNLVLAICFGLGALLAGFAGSLVGTYQGVTEVMGLNYAITAIVVMVLGGLGSVPGSFIGGIIIGIVGSIVTYYESSLVLPAYYALFLIILLVKPQGLLGKK